MLPIVAAQFDTYRYMRQLTGGDWAAACPTTNCLWMAYLAEASSAHLLECPSLHRLLGA